MLLPIIVVAMLAVPGARAQPAQTPTLSSPRTKLDWPVFTRVQWARTSPEQPYYGGVGLRFGGPASGWDLFGSAAEGTFFTLAVINAFLPRWLPKGMSRGLNLNGTGGRSPSDVGVDDYGMGYSAH